MVAPDSAVATTRTTSRHVLGQSSIALSISANQVFGGALLADTREDAGAEACRPADDSGVPIDCLMRTAQVLLSRPNVFTTIGSAASPPHGERPIQL
jgi:hypothetical protein